MHRDRDRLQDIMEMFHQFGLTMISADSLEEEIECGVFRPTASLVIGRRPKSWARPWSSMALSSTATGATPCSRCGGVLAGEPTIAPGMHFWVS